jgi:hypothetical protein
MTAVEQLEALAFSIAEREADAASAGLVAMLCGAVRAYCARRGGIVATRDGRQIFRASRGRHRARGHVQKISWPQVFEFFPYPKGGGSKCEST